MRVLDPSEASQLLAAIDLRDPFGVRDHAMLVFALNTGLRVSELVGLNVGNVALGGAPRPAIFVSRAIAKGGRERSIPLNDTAQRAVTTLLRFNQARGFSTEAAAPLFVTRKHERVSVRLVQRLVQTLRERADLTVPATPHTLRHYAESKVMPSAGFAMAA